MTSPPKPPALQVAHDAAWLAYRAAGREYARLRRVYFAARAKAGVK